MVKQARPKTLRRGEELKSCIAGSQQPLLQDTAFQLQQRAYLQYLTIQYEYSTTRKWAWWQSKGGICIKQTTTIVALCCASCLYIISYTVHSLEYCYVLLLFGTGGSRSERATGSTAIQSAMRRRSLKERRDVKVSLGSCCYSDLICLLSLFLSL
jgi:hypothetical protein